MSKVPGHVPGPSQLPEFSVGGHSSASTSSKQTVTDLALEFDAPITTIVSVAIPKATLQSKLRFTSQPKLLERPCSEIRYTSTLSTHVATAKEYPEKET